MFREMLIGHGVDIIFAISETCLNTDISTDVASISLYRLVRADRVSGVGFFVKQEVTCKKIHSDFR